MYLLGKCTSSFEMLQINKNSKLSKGCFYPTLHNIEMKGCDLFPWQCSGRRRLQKEPGVF